MRSSRSGAEAPTKIPTASDANELIEDLPPGPFDKHRTNCRFDWKLLKISIEDPDLLKFKEKVWKELEKEKEFQPTVTTLSAEEQKRRTTRQMMRFHAIKHNFLTEVMDAKYKQRTKNLMAMNEALALVNRSLSVKFAMGISLFNNTLTLLGTERHVELGRKAWSGELLGSVAITEIAHGSNTKKLRTTATYDPARKEFVIDTPDFEAAKCWVGNLGRTCSHALVFAQLITPDGERHGLHGFVVPVRDPGSLLPYPGITVGDMGEKNGLNGLDNGFIIFDKYRIPKENLLNKMGDVNDDGAYETSFTNPQQILGAALETLNAGRLGIIQEASMTLCSAVTIAIRYAALRKQFGPTEEEIPILEYPLHQWRLFPYLGAAVVFRIFVWDFVEQYLTVIEESTVKSNQSNFGAIVGEIHAIVASSKPLITWACRDALQECREACGGHGYLKAANLGEMRSDHDPSVTFEGDNNVLIQQTSNWLVRQLTADREENRNSVFQSTRFLDRFAAIMNYKFMGREMAHVVNHEFIVKAFEWLLCYLIKETDVTLSVLQSRGVEKFTARAHAQLYKARTLSLVFAEYNASQYAWNRIIKPGLDPNVKIILEKLYMIFGLWCIDRHLVYFYQGGFSKGSQLASLVRDGLISLCSQILPDAVSVVDAIAPPDFVLNSVIGQSNGHLYDNLKTKLLTQPGSTERAEWWRDAVPSFKSKL